MGCVALSSSDAQLNANRATGSVVRARASPTARATRRTRRRPTMSRIRRIASSPRLTAPSSPWRAGSSPAGSVGRCRESWYTGPVVYCAHGIPCRAQRTRSHSTSPSASTSFGRRDTNMCSIARPRAAPARLSGVSIDARANVIRLDRFGMCSAADPRRANAGAVRRTSARRMTRSAWSARPSALPSPHSTNWNPASRILARAGCASPTSAAIAMRSGGTRSATKPAIGWMWPTPGPARTRTSMRGFGSVIVG